MHDNDDTEMELDSEQARAMAIICSPTSRQEPVFER
jgi:hypothetical protein